VVRGGLALLSDSIVLLSESKKEPALVVAGAGHVARRCASGFIGWYRVT